MKSVLIFDIGKTNKKALLFDYSLNVLWQESKAFPETTDEDGDPCEDLAALLHWMEAVLYQLAGDQRFELTHLNFTTYGASFVHIDREGNMLTPLYNYLKPMPEEIRNKFYQKHGREELIAIETASPSLGFLNSGLQIYYIRERYPTLFKQIYHSLHFPQFLTYHFTRRPFSEYTGIGCHTALWDFRKNTYHKWVFEEKIADKFPPITASNTLCDLNLFGRVIRTGVGIHDSSSALYPYTRSSGVPYFLLSTGTWSIVFNPFSKHPLSKEELENDCLLFLQPNGKPVKASRLHLGHAYQQQTEALGNYFGVDVKKLAEQDVDEQLLSECTVSKESYFSFPSFRKEDKVAINAISPSFKTFVEAYYQMVWELSIYQVRAIQLAAEREHVPRIYIEGGFSKNRLFIACLKKHFPDAEIVLSEYTSGAALGAVLQVLGM
jgi:sugar (pentulose or hexulose) kinase